MVGEYHTDSMFSPQVVFQQTPVPAEGLRLRKKLRTRRAIEDAAVELFEMQGYEATTVEQIAACADVSTTTFFRYFPTKADVILSEQGDLVPALQQAIRSRPEDEDDLDVVRCAFQTAWVSAIDPKRTIRIARAMATSPLLRGLGYEIGQGWVSAISEALARRHGLRKPDRRCAVTARVGLMAFSLSAERWIERGGRGDLAAEMDEGFEMVKQVIGAPEPSRMGEDETMECRGRQGAR